MSHIKTPAERQRKLYQNKKKQGFTKVSVWVPNNCVKILREFATKIGSKKTEQLNP